MSNMSPLREPPEGTVVVDRYGTTWQRCEDSCGVWHNNAGDSAGQGVSWLVIYTMGWPITLVGREYPWWGIAVASSELVGPQAH